MTSISNANAQAFSTAATAIAQAVAASVAKVLGGGNATGEAQALATAIAQVHECTDPNDTSQWPLSALCQSLSVCLAVMVYGVNNLKKYI